MNQTPANAPGGAAGWFSMLSIAMGNNAAEHRAADAAKELKPGDVVTDDQGLKHTYLGKDEYGNNMYSSEKMDGIAYMNPKQDMFQTDPTQISTGTGWYGPSGQGNWMFGAAATLLEGSHLLIGYIPKGMVFHLGFILKIILRLPILNALVYQEPGEALVIYLRV